MSSPILNDKGPKAEVLEKLLLSALQFFFLVRFTVLDTFFSQVVFRRARVSPANQ